jgi:predicted MFS family arabinose efflux permease
MLNEPLQFIAIAGVFAVGVVFDRVATPKSKQIVLGILLMAALVLAVLVPESRWAMAFVVILVAGSVWKANRSARRSP